jgi:hypothetical protein
MEATREAGRKLASAAAAALKPLRYVFPIIDGKPCWEKR